MFTLLQFQVQNVRVPCLGTDAPVPQVMLTF